MRKVQSRIASEQIKLEKARLRRKRLYIFKENFELTLLALPAIVLLFVFNYLPMFGIVIAFKKYNPMKGIMASEWVGLNNFKFFFTSSDALRVTMNTVLYSLNFMFIGLLASVAVALLLYNIRSRAAVKTYNTIMIFPMFISAVLVAFIVYAVLNPASGVLNSVLGINVDWYMTPVAWPFILTIVYLWQTIGYSSIIYYACLMGIDECLFEAAKLDGANKWQQTRYIAIPHLIPVMTITTVLAFGNLFNGDFGLFYQIPRNVGALYPTTDIINTYTFRALMGGNMEVSAAVGLVQSVVGLIMVVVVNLFVKKISPENSLF